MNKNGWNNASKSEQIWGFSSAHFDFGQYIRKCKTMVQCQVAMCAIARSRLQIKSKPVKGSSKNAVLIFSMVGALMRAQYAVFYRFCKEPVRHFMNPDLTNKSWVVHLNCTLMACRECVPACEERCGWWYSGEGNKKENQLPRGRDTGLRVYLWVGGENKRG